MTLPPPQWIFGILIVEDGGESTKLMHTLINLNVKNRVNDSVIILQLAQKHIKDGIIQKD